MVAVEMLAVQAQGFLEQVAGGLVAVEPAESGAEEAEGFRQEVRLAFESQPEGLAEQDQVRLGGDGLVAVQRRFEGCEEVLGQPLSDQVLLLFRRSGAAIGLGREAQGRQQGRDDDQGFPVAPYELAGEVEGRTLPGEHRPPFEASFDVEGELLYRYVAFLRILGERLQHDAVDISGQVPP